MLNVRRHRSKLSQRSKINEDLQLASVLLDEDLQGVTEPVKSLASGSFQFMELSAARKTRSMELLRKERKPFIWRTLSMHDLVNSDGVIENLSLDSRSRQWMTLAPPFLEKDDANTIYMNQSKRFQSNTQLAKGDDTAANTWDGGELVTGALLDRQQVKEVKGASMRLLVYETPPNVNTMEEEYHNPVFQEPVYGSEPMTLGQSTSSQKLDVYVKHASIPKQSTPGDFLYGKEAYQFYLDNRKYLDQLEKEKLVPQINLLRKRLIEKKEKIENALTNARAFYSSQYKPRLSLKEKFIRVKHFLSSSEDEGDQGVVKAQKGHSQFAIRAQLEDAPVYTPWLTFCIVLLHVVTISIMCVTKGVVVPSLKINRNEVKEIMTWSGPQTVEHFILPNPWAGPSYAQMISSGALYAPCVRNDKVFLLRTALYEVESTKLGCCEAKGRGAGTTTERECDELRVLYNIRDLSWKNVTCSERVVLSTREVPEPHDFKPCCLPYLAKCLLLTHKHCVILEGEWHLTDAEHCSQVGCGNSMCEIFSIKEQMKPTASRKQFWRLALSLIYHNGIVLAVLYSIILLYIGLDVERITGWWLFAFIYLIFGIGSLLLGSTLRPYEPLTGCAGVICGLLAMRAVEYILLFSLIQKRIREAAKLVFLTLFMLGLGLLPGVNQFVNISGFALGVMCAFAFMPHIKYTKKKRIVMMVMRGVSYLELIAYFSAVLYLFYIRQPQDFGSLNYFNCLAFMPYACDNNLP